VSAGLDILFIANQLQNSGNKLFRDFSHALSSAFIGAAFSFYQTGIIYYSFFKLNE